MSDLIAPALFSADLATTTRLTTEQARQVTENLVASGARLTRDLLTATRAQVDGQVAHQRRFKSWPPN